VTLFTIGQCPAGEGLLPVALPEQQAINDRQLSVRDMCLRQLLLTSCLAGQQGVTSSPGQRRLLGDAAGHLHSRHQGGQVRAVVCEVVELHLHKQAAQSGST